ncbi:acyl-CoA thioesterase [Candidatus Sumerlaeota bacterium]|nr:acyl-CoA thioesterase [Candidatus Sumerlaeota bacterium]
MSDTATPKRAPEVRIMDIVFPADSNSLGTMFGGSLMARMDKAAVMAAIRYHRGLFVTISTDGLQFLTPIKQGDIIECIARVAFVGRTSVVVKVQVHRESHFSEAKELCTTGWFALAGRGQDGKPAAISPLLLETDQERRDWEEARAFRERSLQMRK